MVLLSGLSGYVSLLLALLSAHARAIHNAWWSCNSECARCVRMVNSMEDLIVQFYPGLFNRAPPENVIMPREMAKNISYTIDSGTAEIPDSDRPGTVSTNNVSHGSFNPPIFDFSTSSRRRQHYQSVPPGCCETEIEYHTPNSYTVRGQVYQVVHLSNTYQFIPYGKCKENSTCIHGECREQFRAHWVLIYNATNTAIGPPVSFSAIEVPSHCECMNVGKSSS